ncbi:GIY-YIG nuclease family protein [Cesiribacter sp. SM1]|uniref:GIY-YIG nuclease family protein n=1 Tax=Cesiribacter sp. SM1 TaxID=2861196 RepID=UPI001CD58EF9|nr:GIY-YIG nuclease family protein [Cesiribacter sp. SM1]
MKFEECFWELMGSLSSPISKAGGGVYLLVFKGTPKRVIYVGTTNNFNNRIDKHRRCMLEGKRTIWKADVRKDIYELMSHMDEKNPYKYYASLAKRNLLWATTDINKTTPTNDLLKKDSYEENWKDFVHNQYIHAIEVWALETGYSDETNKRIESQIQTALKNRYSIGSHIHNKGMCWLGKIEYADDVFNTSFTFSNAPDISEEF